jgi:aspartate racemase
MILRAGLLAAGWDGAKDGAFKVSILYKNTVSFSRELSTICPLTVLARCGPGVSVRLGAAAYTRSLEPPANRTMMMKTIGVIGGMRWESSAEYYRLINRCAKARLGGHHNARSLMVTVDFAGVEALQRAGDWDALGAQMAEAAKQLERGGAQIVLLATNTMHRVCASIEAAITVPFLHIADPTGAALKAAGVTRAGLLGTRYTMEQDFYVGRLRERHGIEAVVPCEQDREDVHRIIYDELCHGIVENESRRVYQRVIEDLRARGAQAVILGCTEITLLIGPDDSVLPVFDTTALHAQAAVDWAIGAGQ